MSSERRKICVSILMATIFSIFLATDVLATGGSKLTCTDQEIADCLCFEDRNVVVKADYDPVTREFPRIDEFGNTVFRYFVDCKIKNVNVAIPNTCNPILEPVEYCINGHCSSNIPINPGNNSSGLFFGPRGDSCTLFATGFEELDAWRWRVWKDAATVSITFKGSAVGKKCGSLLVQTGGCKNPHKYRTGRIIVPDCPASAAGAEGVQTETEYQKITSDQGPEGTESDLMSLQSTSDPGPPYTLCLKAVKNLATSCYEEIAYACPLPGQKCSEIPDNAYCPFSRESKEDATVVQFSGEPACANVIRIPDEAAYSLCVSPKPACENIGPATVNNDGSFSNPCGARCIECVFGGFPYCACW